MALKKCRRILVVSLLVLLLGCANSVRHTISTTFNDVRLETVAVLPVEFEATPLADSKLADSIIRKLINRGLAYKGYKPLPLEVVNERMKSIAPEGVDGPGYKTVVEMLGADAVLYPVITEWDEDLFILYASLVIAGRIELYGGDGERLWSARYKTGDSIFKFDRAYLELFLEAYEPLLERLIDTILYTLPSEKDGAGYKRYFDWLP